MHSIAYKIMTIFALSLIFVSCSKNPTDPIEYGTTTNTYIVVFENAGNAIQGANIDTRINEIFSKHKIDIANLVYTYRIVLDGFAANLTESQASVLSADKAIKYVEKDQIVSLPDELVSTNEKSKNEIQAQSLPWGIADVGGPLANSSAGIAWIVDTGIDLDHPDLNVVINLSKNFVRKNKPADDDNGHGSHVAGIIGAISNNKGVVGVCPSARVVAVKVLNSSGSGSYSTIIAGLDYVALKKNSSIVNVVNLSLGGPTYQPLDNAVANLASQGVYVVIAAGNSAANSNNYSPARVNGDRIYTVSAYGSGGIFASFSNFANPPVDYSAPGVSIYSCYKNKLYATMSGTSMAAPHVAGIILSNNGTINGNGTVTGDKDSTPDTKAHL